MSKLGPLADPDEASPVPMNDLRDAAPIKESEPPPIPPRDLREAIRIDHRLLPLDPVEASRWKKEYLAQRNRHQAIVGSILSIAGIVAWWFLH